MINFINSEAQFFVLCITTLFTLTNPIGIAPILVIMTERFSKKDRINIAKKGSITAFITLILFSLLGSLIFSFFGIKVLSLHRYKFGDLLLGALKEGKYRKIKKSELKSFEK